MKLLGVAYQADSPLPWIVITALLLAGGWWLNRLAPRVSAAYHGAVKQAMGAAAK
jgi:hypothetical protein